MVATPKKLIYGVIQDELYFMPEELARKFARVRYAMENASGWKELKSMVTHSEYREIKEQYEFTFGDEEPDAGEEFDGSFLDEDYYEHPGVHMTDWLPEDVIAGFGKMEMAMLGGPLLHFEPAEASRVIAELEKHGYACEDKTDLLAFATGEYCESIPVQDFMLKKPELGKSFKPIEIIDSDPVPETKAKSASRTSGKKKTKPVKKTKPKSKKPPVKKK